MNRTRLIMAALLVTLLLGMSAHGLRPTFQGNPAASTWYTDTSISNPWDESHFGWYPSQGAHPTRDMSVYDGVNVFARANNNSLLWYHFPKNQYLSPSVSVVNAATFVISSPAVVQRGPNTIDVFYRGAEYRIGHVTWDGSRWSRDNADLGISGRGGIAAASWGPDRIDLFYSVQWGEGEPNIYHRYWNGRSWSSPENLGNLPGVWEPDIAAASWGPNQIDLVVQRQDNAYYRRSYNVGGWSNWMSIPGGIFSSGPGLTAVPPFPGGGGDRRVQIFGQGTDRRLYGLSFDSTGASGSAWDSFGGALNSSPAAVNYVGTHFTVFARGMDGTLWMTDWDVGCCDPEDYYWHSPEFELPSMTVVVDDQPTGTSGGVSPASGNVAIGTPVPDGGQSEAQPSPDSSETGGGVQVGVPVESELDLTGIWEGDDGGNYEIRQIGDQVWWFGQYPDSWANVAYGTFDNLGQLNLNWADVRGSGFGTLVLKADQVVMEAVSKTGGFAGARWKRIK